MGQENTVGKPIKAAIFQHSEHGFFTVMERPSYAKDDEAWSLPEYIRMSEWLELTFPALPPDVLVGTALIALNTTRAKIVNEFHEKLTKVDERIANLRCLAAPVVEV